MISIPIVSEFDGKGISKAVQQFKQLEGAGAKAQFAIKKAAIPAAAAVAGLTAALGDAVSAAIDDQKSQQLLARQLKATTGATDDQIKSVEKYISAQGRNLGVTDDQLRPALAGLVRVTKDVREAQNAASLAMDIAAAKGVSLETVTKSIEKAYGGNVAALAKLDPSVRDMIKSGASLEEVFAQLTKTYGGAAQAASETAAGSFAKLKLSLDETKESVGAALLPAVEKILPKLQSLANWAQDNPQFFTQAALGIGAIATATVAVNAAMAANPYVLAAAGVVALAKAFETLFTQLDKLSRIGGLAARIAGFILGPVSGMAALKGLFGKKSSSKASPATAGGFRAAESALSSVASGAAISGGSLAGLGAGYVSGKAPKTPKKGSGKIKTPGKIVAVPGVDPISGWTGPTGVPDLGMIDLSLEQIDPSIRQAAPDVTINVNGGDPNAVVDALRRYMRTNGAVPIRVDASI